jgi:hypothetical protein
LDFFGGASDKQHRNDRVGHAEAGAKAESSRFPPKQAADTAQALSESLGEVSTLATKADVEQATSELKALIAETKSDILKWMFTSLFAQAAVIVALLKLLP